MALYTRTHTRTPYSISLNSRCYKANTFFTTIIEIGQTQMKMTTADFNFKVV